MFNDVTVIGAGRAGSTIAARLRERGVAVRDDGELRLLCVPDRAIAEVAGAIEPGPWVAHVSGRHAARSARAAHAPLLGASAADADPVARPRAARRCLGRGHSRDGRGPRARAAGSPRRSGCARSCWPTIGARSTTPVRRSRRTSSSRSTGPRRSSSSRRTRPPAALIPLMERTIENDFELTGPIARGDWETVDRHLAALAGDELEPLYRALAEATRP